VISKTRIRKMIDEIAKLNEIVKENEVKIKTLEKENIKLKDNIEKLEEENIKLQKDLKIFEIEVRK
jgi:cell division protein FtsB